MQSGKIDRGRSVFGSIVTASGKIASMFTFAMVLLISADVFGRYVLGKPVPGAFEVSEVLMVFVVFLAYASVEKEGQNIRIQVLERYMTPRQMYALDMLAYLLGMLVFGVICWQGWFRAWEAVAADERLTGLLRVSVWPAKFILVFGALLLVLQFLLELIDRALLIVRRSSKP